MSERETNGGLLRGEDSIVEMLAPLAGNAPGAFGFKDDCAVLAAESGTDFVLKTDPIAEGVHFLASDAPRDVGWKALAVNVSDLAAKGAMPLAYLMALSFPDAPSRPWLAGLIEGLQEAQQQFGCRLLGGDTDRRPGPLTVSITIIGTVPKGGMIRRGAAQQGDVLFVSGTLGDAALGLTLCKEPERAAAWGLSSDMTRYLEARRLRPQPRLALRKPLQEHASAAMDVSDGLAKDLARMCEASGCGAEVNLADIPVSESCRHALAADAALWTLVVAGGDDYEVLASVPAAREERFAQDAAAAGTKVTRIGVVTEGNRVTIQDRDGHGLDLRHTGWDHFGI